MRDSRGPPFCERRAAQSPSSRGIGVNIRRLVCGKYLSRSGPERNPANGAPPYLEFDRCPNVVSGDDSDNNNRSNYFYHRTVDATPSLRRLWPRITNYGRSPSSDDISLVNLVTDASTSSAYPQIARALVTDPAYAHVAGGLGYVTHKLGSKLAFNLGSSDGSVVAVNVGAGTLLPAAGDYKGIVSIVPYLEAANAGNANGREPITRFSMANILIIP